MNTQAILVFAEAAGLDRARRRLPRALESLLRLPSLPESAAGAGVDLHLFSNGLTPANAGGWAWHAQRGASFGEKLENAVAELAALGYQEIVIVGRDCPHLQRADIATAFVALAERRLVLGPDHRGGCYLIALRAADTALLRGISWKQNQDCAQLAARCQPAEVLKLAVKLDLDGWQDVSLLARLGDRCGRLAKEALALGKMRLALAKIFVNLAAAGVRVRGQLPPPLAACA